jgi:hypothetical protein
MMAPIRVLEPQSGSGRDGTGSEVAAPTGCILTAR